MIVECTDVAELGRRRSSLYVKPPAVIVWAYYPGRKMHSQPADEEGRKLLCRPALASRIWQ